MKYNYFILIYVLEHVFINLASASCSSTPTKETCNERQSSNIKEIKNGEEILRQKRYNELFEGIFDLNNKDTIKNEDDTLKYTVDKINDKVIITINNNAPNTLESITPFYKAINDDVINLREIDKEKPNKNIIKVYLVGNDDNILKLKCEIEEKCGDELLVYFYKHQDLNYQNLGCFYTSSQHLLHALSKYTHYFSVDDQSLKHICSSNDSDIKPTYKHSDVVTDDPHQTSMNQNIIQKLENVPGKQVNDLRPYEVNEFLVKSNHDLNNEDVDTDKLKYKGQKDKVQCEAPDYNNIYIENNKPTTEFNIRENPKDETELVRDKSTNVETISQNTAPCNTNINDGIESNIQFHVPRTTVPNLHNLVDIMPSPKPYLPWNIANFNNYGKPCTSKDKNISNTNPTGYEKVPSEIEVKNKIAEDKLKSAIQKLSEEENNKKNQGTVTITPILPVSLSPLPTPYLQTNLNPVLNIPYIIPGLQNIPIKSSTITPSFNQKAEEQNHQNNINEELGKPRKSNIYQTFPYSLTSPVNNILSKPIISSSLQIVPSNVYNVPELTIGKNKEKKGEHNMLSTGLSPSLASLSESPETLTISSSASPVSELISPCAEILSEPKLPLQSISTTISDIPKINPLPVYPYNICNVPELTIGKNLEKKGKNNILSTGLSPSLASLSESPETLAMSSSASPVSELTSPCAQILPEPKLPLQSISTTIYDIPKINSLPVYPYNACNVPELTIGKNIERKGKNNMLSTGLSPSLASLSESPETLAMSSSASPVSELTSPCAEILSEPKLPLQSVSTTISDIPKINSLPICDIPSVVPNLIESVSSTLEAPPSQTVLSNPITETVNKPMSSLVNSVTKLDVPSISVIKENDMSFSKVPDALPTLKESINPITVLPTLQVSETTPPCTSMLEKDSPQTIPTTKHNVPKISVEKDSENITQMFETSTYPTTSNEASVIPTMPTPCLEHSLTPPCTDTLEIPSLPQIVSTTIPNVSEENFIKNATITDNNIMFPEVTNQNISPTTNVKIPDFSPNLSNYFQPLTSSIKHVPILPTLSKSVFPNSIKDNTNSVLSIPHIVQTSPNQLYFPSKKTLRPHNIMFKYPPASHPNLFFTAKPMPTSQINTSHKFNFPTTSSIITGNGEPDNRKLLAVPTITIPTKSSSFGSLLSTNSPQSWSNNNINIDGNVDKIGDALLPHISILPTTVPYLATDSSENYSSLSQKLTNKFNLNSSNIFNPHLFNPKQSDSFYPLLIQKSNILPQEPPSYFFPPFYTSEPSSNPASNLRYFPSESQTKSHPYTSMNNTCKTLDSILFPLDLNKIPIIKSFSNQNQPHMHFPSKLPNNLPISNLPTDSVSTNTINNKPTYLPLNKYSPKQFRPSYHLPLKSDYCKSTQQPLSSTISPLNLKLQSSHYKWPYNNYLKILSPSCKSKEIDPHVPSNTSPEYSSKVFEPRVTATPYPSTAVHISKTPVSSLSILPTINNNGSNAEILPSNANILPSFNLLLPISSTKDVISELYDTSNSGKQNSKLPIPTLPTPVSKAESIMSSASISSLSPTLDTILSPTSFQAPVSSLNMYPASTLSSPITTAPKLETTSFSHPSLVFPYASTMGLSPTISPSTVSSWPIENVKPKKFKPQSMDLPISLTKKDSTMNAECISHFPSAAALELTFPNQRPLISTWPIKSTEDVSPINNMPPSSPLSFKVTPEVCATRTKKPIYELFPIQPSEEVCVKNSPPFVPTYPVSPTPKLRMTSFSPCTSCLYMPSSRPSDLANLPNYVSPLPISSTPESKSVNLQPSKSLLPVSPMIETNSEDPVISAPQLSAFPKKVIGSTSYSFNIPSTSDSISSELDLTDLLARNSPLPEVPCNVTAQPKSTQCFYPKNTLCSSRVSANKLNMQPQFIKICNKSDYFNLKSVAQPQSQLFDNPLTYNSPTNYFKSKVVLSPQSSNDLNSDYLTGTYTPMSYIDTAAPNLDSNSFPNNLSYKSKPSITCSSYNPDTISHDHYPTHKSSATLTKPNSVPEFPEKQEMFLPLTQENKYSNSYLSNIGYKDQTSKLLPSEIRPSILTSKLSKKSKLKFNYTSPESLSSAPFYHNENVIKISPYKDQNEFSNEKAFSPYLSPDKKTQINFDTEYLMNTPNLYQAFDKFVPNNLKVLPNEKLSSSFRNTFRLTSPSIGLTQNNLITNLRPYAKDVCVSDKKVTIPIANILVAKYEPNRFEKINIDTDNPDIKLKMWLSKINTYKAKLIAEVDESNVTNFIPIVKNKGYYSPEYIQDTVKRYVEKYYGKPIVLNGTYNFYNPYALISVNEIKNDDIYVIWPTFCECGCNASGCQCCYK